SVFKVADEFGHLARNGTKEDDAEKELANTASDRNRRPRDLTSAELVRPFNPEAIGMDGRQVSEDGDGRRTGRRQGRCLPRCDSLRGVCVRERAVRQPSVVYR